MCVSYFMLILCTLQLSAFLIVDLLSIKNTLIKIFCMCRRCIYYTMFIYSPLNLNAKNLLRMSRVIIQLEPLIRPVGLSIKFKSTVNRIFFTYHLTYVRKHHHFICHKVRNRSKRINVQIKVIWPVKWVKHLLTLLATILAGSRKPRHITEAHIKADLGSWTFQYLWSPMCKQIKLY